MFNSIKNISVLLVGFVLVLLIAGCVRENQIANPLTPEAKVVPTAAWDYSAASSVLTTPTSTAELTAVVPDSVVPLSTQAPDEQAVRFFLNVESIAENSWSCTGYAGGSLRCRGSIQPDNPSSDRWLCGESDGGTWECRGNVNKQNLRDELWGCKTTTSGSWVCSGDIDGTDATMEIWTCKMEADDSWLCQGNIDKATLGLERWSCIGMGVEWDCSRDLGRLFPLIVPVISTGDKT